MPLEFASGKSLDKNIITGHNLFVLCNICIMQYLYYTIFVLYNLYTLKPDGFIMTEKEKAFGDFKLLVSQLIRKLNTIERDEKDCCGVTTTQAYTIEMLARNGKLPMKELSRKLGVAVSTMTRIIDVMVRNGLVKRKINPKDRRSVLVELTTKGIYVSRKLKCTTEDYFREIFNKIPDDKRVATIEDLNTLLAAIK